jgi:hypothetical protein
VINYLLYGGIYLLLGAVIILAGFKEDWLYDIERNSVRRVMTVLFVLLWPVVIAIEMLFYIVAILYIIFTELFG